MEQALSRLNEERKNWRKDHPFEFYARPKKLPDGTCDMLTWECGVPGKEGGLWEGFVYDLEIFFTEKYPNEPPECFFISPIFHPNVYVDGLICLSILDNDWKACLTVKQILLGIQSLLEEPNTSSPANIEAFSVYTKDKAEYERKVREYISSFNL